MTKTKTSPVPEFAGRGLLAEPIAAPRASSALDLTAAELDAQTKKTTAAFVELDPPAAETKPPKRETKAAQVSTRPPAAAKPSRVKNPTPPIVERPASNCPACGSTDREPYHKTTTIEKPLAGEHNGKPYNHIVWRRTKCKRCKQTRIDKTFEMRSEPARKQSATRTNKPPNHKAAASAPKLDQAAASAKPKPGPRKARMIT